MTEWIRVNPRKLNTARVERIGGVDVEVFLSPYDVPEALRGYRDSDGRFVIEFRYMRQDKPDERVLHETHDQMIFRVGKNSHRLYGIEIDPSQVPNDTPVNIVMNVVHQADDVIETLVNEQIAPHTKDNYQATRAAMRERREQLTKQLVG